MHDMEVMPELLASYLEGQTGRSATVESYEQMTGGYSRLLAKALIRWHDDDTTEHMVLRGDPPADQAMIQTDRDQEWSVLCALKDNVPMPRPRWYDGTGTGLGTKTIVLDFCGGPSLQTAIELDGADLEKHAHDFAKTMGHLHTVDTDVLASKIGQPNDWESNLDGLIANFGDIEEAAHEAEPVLRYVARNLSANRPPPAPLVVVHGDFQPANVMIGDDGQLELIDWEQCHIGDPREDLGHYVNYGDASPPNLYKADPEAFLSTYRQATGLSEEVVNQETVSYFAALASVKLWGQILAGASAMAEGNNSGMMTTYMISALTIGRQNFLAGCR